MLTEEVGLPVWMIELNLSNDLVESTVGGDGDTLESFKCTLEAHDANGKAVNRVRSTGDSSKGGSKEEHHAHESE